MNKLEGSCHCGRAKWTYEGPLESVTACNCTICRRYGALWAYGFRGEVIHVEGPTVHYMRGKAIEYHFCAHCGCAVAYHGTARDEQGRQRLAVNLRMIGDPALIADLPIDHFDGFGDFVDLPRDGRYVRDLWF